MKKKFLGDISSNIDCEEIYHFDRLADSWWDSNGSFKTLHMINPIRLNWIKDIVGNIKGKKILDVGCGGGILTESLVLSGAMVTGIDVSKNAINIAKAHCSILSNKPTYYQSSIELFSKQIQNDKFDVVTCMEILEHSSNPINIINNCFDLLKDGGFLICSTLNRNIKSFIYAILAAEYIFNIIPQGTHKYEKFIKPSELSKIMKNVGLELIDIKGINFNPFKDKFSLSNDVSINYMIAAQK